jgi:hypothetical protein
MSGVSYATNGTTVGPVAEAVRDKLANYRDANDHPSYNAALVELLEEADTDE